MDLKFFLERGSEHFLPHLSVDLVIIGYDGQLLKCLLLKMAEKWLLPGGYIGKDESVEHAAERVLKERTGLENPHLQFWRSWASAIASLQKNSRCTGKKLASNGTRIPG